MTKGIIHSRREKFVSLMVEVTTGEQMIAVYKQCFPACKKDSSARASCYRMLQDDDIVTAIDKLKREKEAAIKKAKQKEIERLAKDQVISEVQIDAKLSEIVVGKYVRRRKVVVFNPDLKKHETITVEEEPSERAIISAAKGLYDRFGSYADKTVKHEMGDSFIEMLKEISRNKQQKQHV